ncbi:hypothetical protein [Thermococcus barophilus]|nr:hypothetical protein [Thermococcus barophilus]
MESNEERYKKLDQTTLQSILRDLANYIAENGYTNWKNKQVTKPFLRNKYLYISVVLLNKILTKYGVSSNKVAYALREWENSPYIGHTIVGFYIKGRKRSRAVWVFDMDLLMKYANKKENMGHRDSIETVIQHRVLSKKKAIDVLLNLFYIAEHGKYTNSSNVTPLITILESAYNEFTTYDKLTPHGIRITDELYDVIRNLANIRYPKEKGAIYKVLVDAILSLIAFHILTDEELLKFRKIIVTKQFKNKPQKTNPKLSDSSERGGGHANTSQANYVVINVPEKFS